jgi:hypothetical protein
MEIAIVIVILVLLIWCSHTASYTEWSEPTRRIYTELLPDLGFPHSVKEECGGGCLWRRPASWAIFQMVRLADRDPAEVAVDVRLRLFAGFGATPSSEGIDEQIQQLCALPGVIYDPLERSIHFRVSTTGELWLRTKQLLRTTEGKVQGAEDPKPKPGLHKKIREYMTEYLQT